MKNQLVSISVLAFCLFFPSSCTKTETYVVESNLRTVSINVEQTHWSYSGMDNNNYFYATVSMPEITGDVFDYGMIKMYRTFDFESLNASQIELPYIRHNEYMFGEGEWGFYTETVDYEIGIGKITIFYTASDFDYEIDETFIPEAMQFRCVILADDI